MARKKSASGRARGLTIKSRITRSPIERRLISAMEKSNKALAILEKKRLIGTYASRRLFERISTNVFRYNPKSKFKFHFKKDPSQMTTQEQLQHLKTFEAFLKSPTSTLMGIEMAKKVTKEQVKKSLGEIAEKQLTDEDVEEFFDMQYNEDYNYFMNFIKDSDLYALVMEAKEQYYSEDRFIKSFEQFITINNQDTREKAKKLYAKYVR